MLKREEIINGAYVCLINEGTYHIIENVGNAREKGDRGVSTTPLDELSYDIKNILTGESDDGICEHSGLTSTSLRIATKDEILFYLTLLEADALIDLGHVKKKQAEISIARNNLK